MKRISILLCVGLLFLASCTAEPIGKEEYSSQTSVVEETKKDEFGLNETAVFDTLKFTATKIEESEGEEFFTPEEGNVFVGVNFVIENTSDEEQSVSSLLLFEGYVDDVKADYSISASCVFDEGTLDGTIAPGKKLVGWYALEVPENWTALEIHVKADIFSGNTAKFIFNK